MKHKKTVITILSIILFSALFSSCARTSGSIDPGIWGYDCTVVYDSLGGRINQREVRTTYYEKNAYLFAPSGSVGFLIEPTKADSTLAGWYTAKEDITDGEGNILGYAFKAEDRWDFDVDRVTENITLYARWVPKATIYYLNGGETGGEENALFTKSITEQSGVQPLTPSTEGITTPAGKTLFGYYADPECTVKYDFSLYESKEMIPSDRKLYTVLNGEFPGSFEAIEGFVWDEAKNAPIAGPASEEEEGDEARDATGLFIEKVGFRLVEEDGDKLSAINLRKKQIIGEYIDAFVENNKNVDVYMKFIDGDFIRVSGPSSLSRGGKYYLDGLKNGAPCDGYIFAGDVDLNGITLEATESFTGLIYGNGYTVKNLTKIVSSRKGMQVDTHYSLGLFNSISDSLITDLNFENFVLAINENSGNSMTVGLIAGSAVNTEVTNCSFTGAKIRTGSKKLIPIDLPEGRTIRVGGIFGAEQGCRTSGLVFSDSGHSVAGSVEVTGSLS